MASLAGLGFGQGLKVVVVQVAPFGHGQSNGASEGVISVGHGCGGRVTSCTCPVGEGDGVGDGDAERIVPKSLSGQ
jgi:hypothetical protein